MTELLKVISGGQTGADVGAVLAARLHGLKTGGWMPRGWRTLNGPRPEYATLFDMQEDDSESYVPRTHKNVRDSDATIRFARDLGSPGEICTIQAIHQFNKPYHDIQIGINPIINYDDVTEVQAWLNDNHIKVLNVAGNSHRTWIGMQRYVTCFLSYLFFMLGHDRHPLGPEYERLAVKGY